MSKVVAEQAGSGANEAAQSCFGLGSVKLGGVTASRLIIGGNPFSGFAHQTPQRARDMVRWYTVARIKEALRRAEDIGVHTHLGRADNHIIRTLREYWDDGGKIRWFAQTCPGVGPTSFGVNAAADGGAVACYVHGGVMDNLFANNRLDEIPPAIELIRKKGMAAGIACHNPKVLDWAEANLDLDFYMCCYYNASDRGKGEALQAGQTEWFRDSDRDVMVRRIQKLSRPAIHFKVLAAGRNEPKAAMEFVADWLRPQDAVCVGVFTADKWDMLAEDAQLLAAALKARGKL